MTWSMSSGGVLVPQTPLAVGTQPDLPTGDNDGPLVPLPSREPPARVPPPFPLAAYQALMR